MGNLDAALKRYYRGIRNELPCSRKMRNQILQQIRENVTLFLEQNPSADFDAVQNHFGTAQEIASSYIEDQNAHALLRRMRIKKKVVAIIAGAMALALAIWMLAVAWAIIDQQHTDDGHITVVSGKE